MCCANMAWLAARATSKFHPCLKGLVISTDDEETKCTEAEWRDPDDLSATMPIQGVLPKLYPLVTA
jgi:hypothetical protein